MAADITFINERRTPRRSQETDVEPLVIQMVFVSADGISRDGPRFGVAGIRPNV
jgi:hypothetical protein